ncbi:hypothetical protein EB809_20575 [Marinobacter sp. R17]|uniref:hypothetical protein n=1 Tax=Marinobacter sp. R17 TaxID=2484250 RepID=UPI000F4C1FE9|nr:hypothetical protein [Marinobacter sp. R17]ROT93575.1 hypothetical protein EB809_20575 [Marinobacter sp. R17]
MFIKIALLTFLVFTSFTATAGSWALDCHSGIGRIQFTDSSHATLAVSSNQIVISSTAEREDRTYRFFYSDTVELGRGGMMLNWDSFSKQKSLATGTLLEDGGLLFTWKGFYSPVTNDYIWAKDADYVLKNGQKTMKLDRCEKY